ncbi:MAG TPA: hypothetical protein DF383_07120 [Deltaproteobacteria bacterium]|nr:hypothetical protein [Deltaproteobacteria bacterium]
MKILALLNRIQKLGPELGGVFSYGDLCNLIGSGSELQNKRTIKRLIQEGILFKIQRGFYTTADPDLWQLGCRLQKNAYVSMDSVLAKNLLIGTMPRRSVSLVYSGIGRKILETPVGTLSFFSIKKELIFGLARQKNGVAVADSEKAYLDLLYFYAKGARFVIHPLQEVDLSKLDRRKLEKYLKKYRNPRFVAFVKGCIHDVD